jgi:hypothetical protein
LLRACKQQQLQRQQYVQQRQQHDQEEQVYAMTSLR